LNKLSLDLHIPGSDETYYSALFNYRQYIPLFKGFNLRLNSTVGYEHGYGHDSEIPPYDNFFAGGPNSVRGYQAGTLGPRDTPYNNPYGGTLLTTEQTELILPYRW
jgi:outer membrane protein insertion porin family